MTQLTERERRILDYTREVLAGEPDSQAIRVMGAEVADEIRQHLPDIADLVIARALIQVAGDLAVLSTQLTSQESIWDRLPPAALVSSLSMTFGFAAAELAAFELDFPEANGPA